MKVSNREYSFLPVQRCINGTDVKSLSDLDLLAIVLGSGTRNMNVLELSSRIIQDFNGLSGLVNSGIREIAEKKGIGLTKAIRIHAALELGRRGISEPLEKNIVSSPKAVWNVLLPDLAGLQKEEFWVIIVDNKNKMLKKQIVSIGTVTEAIVHPREVFRDAIKEGGSSIIVAHNHPSGITTPSKEDIETTKRIYEAGKIIGIPLLDHVIISNSSYSSLKETGFF